MAGYEKGVDWHSICDGMWEGRTLQEACAMTGQDYFLVIRQSSPLIRGLLVDIAMLVSAKEDLLKCQQ